MESDNSHYFVRIIEELANISESLRIISLTALGERTYHPECRCDPRRPLAHPLNHTIGCPTSVAWLDKNGD